MINVLIEILVCILLATTIGYCILLDRRLRVLRADEQMMRGIIADLVGATDRAEKAVAGLRSVVNECNETITGHLREAERHAGDLAAQIRSGDDVIARISRIVETARGGTPAAPPQPQAPAPVPADREPAAEGRRRPLSETLAAAQAFAERAQRRVQGSAR